MSVDSSHDAMGTKFRKRAYALGIVIGLLSMAGDAFADPSHYTYSESDGNATITGYTGPGGDIGIPAVLDGYPVISIGYQAFLFSIDLTSVTIPDSVTSIGEQAFRGCIGLISVTIPDSVTSIGEQAFSSCWGLTSVTIPDSVASIGELAFSRCNGLTSVTIPDGVISLGALAFRACADLKKATIGSGVTSIEYGAFQNCSNLTSVAIGNGVTSIEDWAFSGCIGLTSVFCLGDAPSVERASFLSSNPTVYRLESALGWPTPGDSWEGQPTALFSFIESLMYVVHGEDVAVVGALTGGAVMSIPSNIGGRSVTAIGDGIFHGHADITTVTIPNSVDAIGSDAFRDCPNLSVVLFRGDAPPSIGSDIFSGTPTASVFYRVGTEGWDAAFPGVSKRIWPEFTGLQTIGQGLVMEVAADNGQEVVLEARNSLTAGDWYPVGVYTGGAANTIAVSEPDLTGVPMRVYRIRIE